jgi:hypothetical protein
MTDVLFELLTLDCRVDTDGTVRYYNALGQIHRVHGPAVEYANSRRDWCQNGLRHRVDGPAIEWPDGTHDWYIDGEELTQAEWQQVVANMESV